MKKKKKKRKILLSLYLTGNSHVIWHARQISCEFVQRENNTSTASSSFDFSDFASITDLRVVSGGLAVTRVIILHLVEPARNLSPPIRLAIVRSRGSGRPRASDVLSHRKSTCKSIGNLRDQSKGRKREPRNWVIFMKTLYAGFLRQWSEMNG